MNKSFCRLIKLIEYLSLKLLIMILTDLENIVIFICFFSLLFSTICFFLKNTIVKTVLPYTYGNTLLLISNINMIIFKAFSLKQFV